MYESPITIKTEEIARNIIDKQEEYILAQVQMCVDVDKDELIKALAYDRGQYEKGWNDRDSEIVKCKYCRYYDADGWGFGNCYRRNVDYLRMNDNGFCSFGERREDETD